MSDTPFIKFYPSDFLAGTSGLSPAERGVYITLLCLIYEADGPISRDDARLARRCGVPKSAFVRVLDALFAEGKLVMRDGKLSNNRAEKAIVDRANRTQNATHAANARWTIPGEKTEQKQGALDAGAMRAQCGDTCQPEPEPEPDNTHPYGCATGKPAADMIWSDCVIVLKEGGKTERQARSLLGKWTKANGRDSVLAVVQQARGSPDPVAYIEQALKPQKDRQDAVRKAEERIRANGPLRGKW